jgi:hypothetical protein
MATFASSMKAGKTMPLPPAAFTSFDYPLKSAEPWLAARVDEIGHI